MSEVARALMRPKAPKVGKALKQRVGKDTKSRGLRCNSPT